MPRGDKTGPNGMGPMTGRGLGFCNGYSAPGFMNPGFGRGMGRGFGRGFGWRRMAFMPLAPVEQVSPVYHEPQLTKEQEKQILKAELKEIEAEKQEIEKRLKEIK